MLKSMYYYIFITDFLITKMNYFIFFRLSTGRWSNARISHQQSVAGNTPKPPLGPTCDNHDDGTTRALVLCADCGALCADCDRIFHLSRKARDHIRTVS